MTEDSLTAAIPLAHLSHPRRGGRARLHRAVGHPDGRQATLRGANLARPLTAGGTRHPGRANVRVTQLVLATALDWAPHRPAAKAALPLVPLAAVMASRQR